MENTDRELDWGAVALAVRQYASIQAQEKVLAPRKKELRDRLLALAKAEGVPDDKGHLRFMFPEPVEGIAGLKVENRVSRTLDEEKAEEVLKSIVVDVDGVTLWDECIEYVPQLDEDAVMAAHYNGVISQEQIDEMYPISITEAFVPVKA